jgi:hypothetical protein
VVNFIGYVTWHDFTQFRFRSVGTADNRAEIRFTKAVVRYIHAHIHTYIYLHTFVRIYVRTYVYHSKNVMPKKPVNSPRLNYFTIPY